MSSYKWPATGGSATKIEGPASSTDNAVVRFNGTTGILAQNSGVIIDDSNNVTGIAGLTATGTTTLNTSLSGPVRASSGVISTGNTSLTSEVTGTLPVGNGGTNSNAALSNNRVIKSAGGAIVEAAAITASRALISDANGIPTHSAVTSTTLAFLDATSSVQTQIDTKQATITGAATTVVSANLTVSRAVISNGSGKLAVSATTDAELGYVNGVTSAIQTQLDGKQATITGGATSITSANLTVSRALVSDGSGKVAVATTTSTEIGYVNGVTSAIQTQLDAKLCATSVAAVSSDVTLTNKRIHFVDTSSARSLTLPSPSSSSFIVVKDKTGSAATNNITIVRAAAEKIETVAASYVLNSNLGSWTFVSDGTDWFII